MFFKSDNDKSAKRPLPALPLRDIIVFPHMVSQLFVGREKSIAALDEAMARDKEIFLAAQKNAKTNDPTPDDIYSVGTIGSVVQLLRLADGTVKVLVEGRRRARIRRYVDTRNFFLVDVDIAEESADAGVEVEALIRSVQSTFEVYVKLNKKVQPEVLMSVQSIAEPAKLSDTIAANLPTIKLADRQSLLEMLDSKQRLERLYELMQAEIEILQVEKKIRSRVKKQMEKTQKEYYLNEQMQAIQKELGGGERDEFKNELGEIEEKLKEKQLTEEAREKVQKEVKKLKMMHPTSAEATVVRNYIDWVLALPWGEKTEERYDVAEAETILDEDHYGLTKCKERIIEYLAVQALTKKLKGPVLCFVGPPGVGKTSLAKSIARATGRKFVRLSLGGVRDEAEIRGAPADIHRRSARQADPESQEGRLKQPGVPARRDRQDEHRFSRGPGSSAAGSSGPGAKPLLQRSLPRSRLRPDRCDVSDHGEYARRHPDPAARSHGDHRAYWVHRVREAQHCAEVSRPAPAQRVRPRGREPHSLRERRPYGHPPLHERGRRAFPRA